MFCKNCGTALNDNETVCPNCNTEITGSVAKEEPPVSSYVYTDSAEIKNKVNATALLVCSIVELICCNQIFGIIALVLYCTSLQNEIKAGNLQGAMKAKKTITWVLIGGIIFSIVAFIITFVANIGMLIISEL